MTTSALGDLGGQLVGRRRGRRRGGPPPEVGGEAGGLGRPVADHRGRRDDQRGPVAGGAGAGGRARWGSCPGPCRGPGSRPARPRRGSRARPAPRPGSCAARRRSPRGRVTGVGGDRRGPVEQVGGPAAALDADAHRRAASPRGRARGAASRRPVSWVVSARSARAAAAASQVGAVELDPAAAGAHQRAGLGGQAGDVGGGRARRRRTRPTSARWLSWWAPTTDVAGGLGEQPQRRRWACGADSAGTRTSNPAAPAARPGHGHQLPGLVLAQVHLAPAEAARAGRSAGKRRSRRASCRRAISALVAGVDQRDLDRARRSPSGPGPSTERNQASPLSGGSSCTTRRPAGLAVTGLAHRSSGADELGAGRAGGVEGEPSRRARKASATSAGGAGLRRARPGPRRAWPHRGRWRRPCR